MAASRWLSFESPVYGTASHRCAPSGSRQDLCGSRLGRFDGIHRVALAAAAAAAAGIVAPLTLIRPASIDFQANALAEFDARSGHPIAVVPVGDTPSSVTQVGRDLWVANRGEATVSRVDLAQGRVVRTIPVPGTPLGITSGDGSVWVMNSDLAATRSTISRIDLRYHQVTANIHLPASILIGSGAGITWDGRSVWAVTQAGDAFQVSPGTNRVVSRVPLEMTRSRLCLRLVRCGRRTGATTRSAASSDQGPSPPRSPLAHSRLPSPRAQGRSGSPTLGEDAVRRIDPRTNSVIATIRVGDRPEVIAASSREVWVGNVGDQTLMRIDPRSNRITKTVRLGYTPASIALVRGRVWVALQQPLPRPPQPTTSGNRVLRLLTSSPGVIDSLDPAIAYTTITWQIEYATCARLYNHADAPPPSGYRLLPEIAASLPAVGKDGRSYTIPIRRGFRFSPPSNQVVTARTFKYSIERALNPKTRSFAVNFMSDIVGARAFEQGHAAHIAGLVARRNSLLVRLERPVGDLAARLAMPFFCPVPLGTPIDFKGLTNIPSAGPYYVSSYVPNRQIVLVRNPNYHGSRPRRSQTIRITPAATERDALQAVESNQEDAVIDAGGHVGIPDRYRNRLIRIPLPLVHYLALNTARPLFAERRVRQAVALAVDRVALSSYERDYRAIEGLLPLGSRAERVATTSRSTATSPGRGN